MGKNITYYNVSLVKERAARIEFGNVTKISTPFDCYRAIENIFELSKSPQEKFVMLALDTKLQIAGAFTVHIGTTSSTAVCMKDVFQRAILTNATSIVVAHNHPSGHTEPSDEDINMTRRVVECGQLMGIEVLDHIVVGHGYNSFCSLKEKGYI